jgi:hypothetical protein
VSVRTRLERAALAGAAALPVGIGTTSRAANLRVARQLGAALI